MTPLALERRRTPNMAFHYPNMARDYAGELAPAMDRDIVTTGVWEEAGTLTTPVVLARQIFKPHESSGYYNFLFQKSWSIFDKFKLSLSRTSELFILDHIHMTIYQRETIN